MAVDSAISSIANSSSSYSATSKGKTSGSDLDKEAFLNLLVTQMQYQDPLNPSDNTEYMSQLAQYSALEAQLNISDTLDKGNNLNLVGKYVIMNTTDSSGKQAMISGLVEYATVKDGDVYLSVNNTYYPAEDLDSVIDYDYYLYLKSMQTVMEQSTRMIIQATARTVRIMPVVRQIIWIKQMMRTRRKKLKE